MKKYSQKTKKLIGLDSYKIVKELGSGYAGTVYLVVKNGKYYALKIEKVLEEEVTKNYKYFGWREIDFANQVASRYPNQFIELVDYDFIGDCKHVQKTLKPIEQFSDKIKDLILRVRASEFCFRRIYTLVDNSVDHIIRDLKKQQIYSIFIQILYIVYLIHSKGYVHGDLQLRNIGIIKTDKKNIMIFGKKIPCFGYICKAIDYGSILHKKYSLDLDKLKMYDDVLMKENCMVYHLGIDFENFYNEKDRIEKENNIKINYKDAIENIRKTEEYKNIGITDDAIKFIYFKVKYVELFQKMVLGKYYKKMIHVPQWIDVDDIIFCYINNKNIKKQIFYLLDRLNEM
jgi:serine/threonine protein kinase